MIRQIPRPRASRRRFLSAASFGLLLFLAVAGAKAQEPEAQEPDTAAVEVVRATLDQKPGHREVRSVRLLKRGGGRVDWSAQGDWLAFDQSDGSGRHHIYVMRVDGTAEECVTCENYDLVKSNLLNPVWHPSGEILVFQVQDVPKRLVPDPIRLATPERGFHGELWATTRRGLPAWQLTRAGEDGRAILDPHFSFEGDQLVWAERFENRSRPWGGWWLQVADFEIRRGLPRLGKVREYEPGARRGWIDLHGFTPDERGVLLSKSPRGSGLEELALHRFDFEDGALVPLVEDVGETVGVAGAMPGRDLIVWASSRAIDPPQRLPWRQDLWLGTPGGVRQERLTFFNDSASGHFLGEALVTDLAWSPQGDRFAVSVVSANSEGAAEAIYLVVLDPSYKR